MIKEFAPLPPPGERWYSEATAACRQPLAGISASHAILVSSSNDGPFMKNMKASSRILVTLFVGAVALHSQDRYPVKQLTRGAFPSWSPDGKTIVYSFQEVIDGKRVFGSRKISADGGTPVQFTDFLTEHPQWSPDGRFIVFDADSGTSINMIEAEGGRAIKLLPDSIGIRKGGLPCWSPTGAHIAFIEGITLSLCVYDVRTGSVKKIFREEGLVPLPGCWSRDGKSILIALMESTSRLSTVWQISSDGKDKQQITGHRDSVYRYLALSPDGSLLVYAAMQGKRLGLWIMSSEGGNSLPLTVTEGSHNESPAWSPDGKRIAFARRGHIYIMDVDIENIKAELALLNK